MRDGIYGGTDRPQCTLRKVDRTADALRRAGEVIGGQPNDGPLRRVLEVEEEMGHEHGGNPCTWISRSVYDRRQTVRARHMRVEVTYGNV